MICYTPQVHLPMNLGYAISAKGKYWRIGDTIDIHFIDGERWQHRMVKEVLEELHFINLKFKFVNSLFDSDVRISFIPGIGSWSYIGTDCLAIPKSNATMNFGWLDYGTIRHEIGHMLGLLHEHQNPNTGIKWDEKVVIKELSGPPNNWDEARIQHNVLRKPSSSTVNFTNFDPNSVMLYFFPDHWTLDGKGTKSNSNWSKIDKNHLMKFYPKDNCIAQLNRWLESLI